LEKQNTELSGGLGRFQVILADPPWKYEHPVTDNRNLANQYPTLTLDELKSLPVAEIAAEDSVLFLWVPNPKLGEAFEVIEAWGFQYRTSAVWVKDKIGMGYYFRQQHELLLLAKRGNLPVPDPEARPSSVIEASRGQHSQKPVKVYDLIERMYPNRTRIELFARGKRQGWEAWGNQATDGASV